jgi:Fe2+ transport system protein FeoA
MTGPEDWRVEADEAWLAVHRSAHFERMRRRLRSLGVVGDSVSNAELGPFGAAPRKPELKIGGRTYSYVRYADQRIAYTTIVVDLQRCRRCGRRLLEVHRAGYMTSDGQHTVIGTVRMCRRCQADSWMFTSRMPSTRRARRVARKVVL